MDAAYLAEGSQKRIRTGQDSWGIQFTFHGLLSFEKGQREQHALFFELNSNQSKMNKRLGPQCKRGESALKSV
jgi:hypothetical protein